MLEVRGLTVHYGGIRAVKGIDLDIAAGEKVALIGANGAGKTSTLKALARMLPAGGEVRFDGGDISHAPPHTLVGRGLALVPEGRGVFARLSVRENLDMGAYARDDRAAIASDLDRVFTLLPRLKERAGQTAGTLSGGEQQMVAIGRALMSRPRLLLLDEPSSGLNAQEIENLRDWIVRLNAEGITILLVSHDMGLMTVAHTVHTLYFGEIVASGDMAAIQRDPRVREVYLGV